LATVEKKFIEISPVCKSILREKYEKLKCVNESVSKFQKMKIPNEKRDGKEVVTACRRISTDISDLEIVGVDISLLDWLNTLLTGVLQRYNFKRRLMRVRKNVLSYR
jgi:hypothetical protein